MTGTTHKSVRTVLGRGFAACALGLAMAGPAAEAMAQETPLPRPGNISSHRPEFFRSLLEGRVWVFERDGRPAATYFGKDGEIKGCAWPKGAKGYLPYRADTRWKIGTPNGRSNLEINWSSSEGLVYSRRVIVYEPRTGRFHGEKFSTGMKAWYVERDGWIQDGWPAVFRNACNRLTLPWDLATARGQDSLDFSHMRRNAQPIVRFPGSEFSYPGATGIGDSAGKPTMTIEEIAEEERRSHGMIRERSGGGRFVGVRKEAGAWELWQLNDRDEVVEIGSMTPNAEGTVMRVRWEKSGRSADLRVGYPIPAMSTGKLYAPFAMMRDLSAARRPVSVDGAQYVFSANGGVTQAGQPGRWRLSRGEVHVKFGSAAQSWPWRVFAGKAGWKQG